MVLNISPLSTNYILDILSCNGVFWVWLSFVRMLVHPPKCWVWETWKQKGIQYQQDFVWIQAQLSLSFFLFLFTLHSFYSLPFSLHFIKPYLDALSGRTLLTHCVLRLLVLWSWPESIWTSRSWKPAIEQRGFFISHAQVCRVKGVSEMAPKLSSRPLTVQVAFCPQPLWQVYTWVLKGLKHSRCWCWPMDYVPPIVQRKVF